MKRYLILAIGLALGAGASSVHAQTPSRPQSQRPPEAGAGEISGRVIDATSGAAVPAASVAVFSAADSALVTGTIVGNDGVFRIRGLQPGSYYLRVSALGYAPLTSEPPAITAAAPRANLGGLGLTVSAVALEGITVEAERSQMAIAPDRNVYAARSVAPAATTVTEILEAVPSVQVDADGKVSLRGNDNVAVQINGRPTPIRGEQLAAYLRQLPANTIDRVEVVPNPSARHDPEGMAGIINIVMKQGVDLGLSGGLMLAGSTADRYNGSGNLGYQSGPWTAFLSYGYIQDERRETGINERTRLGGTQSPLSFTEQDIRDTNGSDGHNFGATVDYRLNQRDVISNNLTLNVRGASEASLSAYNELDASRELTDSYARISDSGTEGSIIDYTLGFKRTLEPQKHEISTEVRVNRSDDEDRTTLWRESLSSTGDPAGGRVEGEINDLDALTYQFTAQADYTRALAERTKLETGYKGNGRWIERDYTVLTDPNGTDAWAPSDRSNSLELDETVNAVYGVLSHGTGKVDLQGGLRAEYATRDFSLIGAESYPHEYTSLFPSAAVAYNLTDRSQARVSYSRRIRRPGTQELNPFPVFFDLQNVFIGNPQLDPEYTDAIELSVQGSGQLGSLQISPFYRRTTDVIRFIIDTDDVVAGREVTTVSFQNLDTGTSWGTDVNGQLRLGSVFSGLAGFNIFKMVTDGTGGEGSLSSDAVTWMARFNGTVNVTPRTSLQAMYMYRAPMDVERGRFSAASMANFVVRHKLYGDRASVVLRLSDPFEGMRFRIQAGDDNVIQLTERQFNSRALHLTFQYNFGQAPKIRRPEQQPAETGPGFPG